MQRRQALRLGAAATVFQIVPRHVLGGPNYIPPSERINLALIGAGGRGRQVLEGVLRESDVRVIAVADPAESFSLERFYYRGEAGREPIRRMVDRHYTEGSKKKTSPETGAAKSGSGCQTYVDFREMLDAERDLDAVICATPDHLHAYVSSVCLTAGKHVYCEKPLTHNIWEARQIAALTRQTGLATQMGNQGHSTDGIRETCELIWAGAIGEVHDVKAWVSGHRWNPSLTGAPRFSSTQAASSQSSSAQSTASIPSGLNWDLWLGPREYRDFAAAYFPVAWRDFWDFGNSNIGDFACHDLDAACWALDLKHPTSIDFVPAGVCNQEIGPHGCLGYFDFPATDRRGSVKVTWYDGGLRPAIPAAWPAGKQFPSRGVLFTGSEGQIYCGGAGGKPQLLPEERFKNYRWPTPSIPRVPSHARNWLDAIRGVEPAGSNFEYGARLTEIALLGSLSLRTGGPIRWDAESMQAIGAENAASIIRENYRPGWELRTS